MSSFVEKLRMNNIFPTGGMNLGFSGQLPQYGGSDPMEEIVNRFSRPTTVSQPASRSVSPSSAGNAGALSRIADQNSQPLKFGGEVRAQSNPGADILNRAARHGEELYDSYGKPGITAGEMLGKAGIKANDQDPGFTQAVKELNPDLQLNRDVKQTQINENKARTTEINNRENVTEDKAWKLITITDPNDPTRQINARYNTITNKTEPITVPGKNTVQPGASAKTNLTEIEKKKKEDESEGLLRTHAQDALSVLDEISKATGQSDAEGNSVEKLSPNTENITGTSGNMPSWLMDLSPDNASARASIKRLTDMLTLDRMQSLRAQSKTGSTGFGSNMNQKEFGTLVSAASKLSTMNQSEPSYAKELGRVRTLLTKVANGKTPVATTEVPDAHSDATINDNGDMEKESSVKGVFGVSKDGGKTWQVK